MNELVFLTDGSVNAKLYTTGDVIAQYAGMTHHAVNSLIYRYRRIISRKGKRSYVAFEMQRTRAGRLKKLYRLNEKQSSFLITLFHNTPQVVRFKDALNEEFYAMKEELIARHVAFKFGKQSSKGLNDAIANSDVFKGDRNAYSNLNRLMYKQALGMNTAQIKKLRGIPEHHSITEYLTADESAALSKIKERTMAFVGAGMTYSEIKAVLNRQGIIYQIKLDKPQQAITG